MTGSIRPGGRPARRRRRDRARRRHPAWNRIAQVARPASPDVEDPDHGEAPGAQPPRLDPRAEPVLRLGLHGHLDHPGRRRVGRQRAGARPVPDPGEQRDRARRQTRAPTRAAAVRAWLLRGTRRRRRVGLHVLDDHSPPIAEHPVGDGVAHRIHLRPKVASQASRRDRFVMVPQDRARRVLVNQRDPIPHRARHRRRADRGGGALHGGPQPTPPGDRLDEPAARCFPVSQRSEAPDFTGIDGWLNSPPLTLADLRGKVVLIDFWTFSCVNCVRTIPHLKVLYDDYKNDGLRHRRRALPGVRLREGAGQRRRGRHAPRGDLAGGHRQRDGHVERVSEPVLARGVPPRSAGPGCVHELRRGRLPADRRGGGAAAQRARRRALPSSTPVPRTRPPSCTRAATAGAGSSPTTRATARSGPPTSYPDPGPPQQQDAIQVTGTWTDEGQYLQADATGHVRLNFTGRHRLHRRRHARGSAPCCSQT